MEDAAEDHQGLGICPQGYVWALKPINIRSAAIFCWLWFKSFIMLPNAMPILPNLMLPNQNKADIIATKSMSTKCSRRPDGSPCTEKDEWMIAWLSTLLDVEYKCRKNVRATVSALREHLNRAYTDDERQRARQNLKKRMWGKPLHCDNIIFVIKCFSHEVKHDLQWAHLNISAIFRSIKRQRARITRISIEKLVYFRQTEVGLKMWTNHHRYWLIITNL